MGAFAADVCKVIESDGAALSFSEQLRDGAMCIDCQWLASQNFAPEFEGFGGLICVRRDGGCGTQPRCPPRFSLSGSQASSCLGVTVPARVLFGGETREITILWTQS